MVCGKTPLAAGKCKHVAIIAETAKDARDVMVGDGRLPGEGSGLMQVHPKDFMPLYEPSKRRMTWPNGAVASIYNGSEPDQLRGPQHDAAWCDELAKWQYAQESWDQLQFGLRLGLNPQVLVSTTPRPIKLLKDILSDPGTVVTRGSTLENTNNLAPQFVNTIQRKYAGTRLGRQEIFAEILDDVPGAMWSRDRLDALRIVPTAVPPLKRIVVAIDPAVTSGEDADETGIIVAGIDYRGNGYILDDGSGVMPPNEWATLAIKLYNQRGADRIIAEKNNGGDMVENTIRAVNPNVSYKGVHASRGKAIRAEPVSALYEQGRVHHVGAFAQLEDQMCAFTQDFDRSTAGYSPDRLDAMVWAITELMLGETAPTLFFG
jgi:phage terminase large subunit-like protein